MQSFFGEETLDKIKEFESPPVIIDSFLSKEEVNRCIA